MTLPVESPVLVPSDLCRFGKPVKTPSSPVHLVTVNSGVVVYAIEGGPLRPIRVSDKSKTLFTNHKISVRDVKFLQQSSIVSSRDADGNVEVWEIDDSGSTLSAEGLWKVAGKAEAHALSSDGLKLALMVDETATVYSEEGLEYSVEVEGLEDVAWVSNKLVTIGEQVTVFEEGKQILKIDMGDLDMERSVGLLGDSILLLGGESGLAMVDITSGTVVGQIDFESDSDVEYHFSPPVPLSATHFGMVLSYDNSDGKSGCVMMLINHSSEKPVFEKAVAYSIPNKILSFDVEQSSPTSLTMYLLETYGVYSVDIPTGYNGVMSPKKPVAAMAPAKAVKTPKPVTMSGKKITIAKRPPQVTESKVDATETTRAADRVQTLADVVAKSSDPVAVSKQPTPVQQAEPESADKSSRSSKAESGLMSRLDKLFEIHHLRLMKSMEIENAKREQVHSREMHELINAISGTINRVVPEQVDRIVSERVINTVIPVLHQEIAKGFGAINKGLEQSIGASMTSDMLAKATKDSISSAVQQHFKKLVLPALVSSFSNMYKQVDERMQADMKARESRLNSLFEEQKAFLSEMTLAETKLPVDSRKAILASVEASDYEEAFLSALSTGDMSVVTWLCGMLEAKMWGIQPKLSGTVLLSLVQQLSCDLTTDAALKLTWMSSSVLSLRVADKTISGHLGRVLPQVLANIEGQLGELGAAEMHSASMIERIVQGLLLQL